MIMHKKRMNPTSVAKAAGLSVNTVRKIIQAEGEIKPRGDTLEEICKVLGIHNVKILDGEDPLSDIRNDLLNLVDRLDQEQIADLLRLARQMQSQDE